MEKKLRWLVAGRQGEGVEGQDYQTTEVLSELLKRHMRMGETLNEIRDRMGLHPVDSSFSSLLQDIESMRLLALRLNCMSLERNNECNLPLRTSPLRILWRWILGHLDL